MCIRDSLGTLLDKALPLLETSKIFLAMNTVFLVLGVRGVQDLTFDCRWWNDTHHGNAAKCHDGFNLYIAAALILSIAQLSLLVISVRFVESERYSMIHDHEMAGLASPAMVKVDDDESMSNL
eukprot:TRINITY_DN1041_c0_g1_i1.p1 TRINITY_DN1041_c0_g1~~TRINITY_DN1041_c0_g1_i1.p1  ORF type:complete len:123 (-),score=49.10 TRINITY_DN1041_c0_g1_i1:71-439(-)